jgi:hypothetical protein
MPLTTSYDAEKQLIRLTGEGSVSMDERRHCIGQMFANSEYANESDILVNVSGIANAPVGSEFLEIAKFIVLLHSRFSGRIAIVNAQVGHTTISHLVALSADLSQDFVRVFYSNAEASAWLDQ